jgi:hypothetical protein
VGFHDVLPIVSLIPLWPGAWYSAGLGASDGGKS